MTFRKIAQLLDELLSKLINWEAIFLAEKTLQEAAMSVKRAIKKQLIDRGMTQKEVAGMIGISEQQMTRAVAGASGPRDIEIRKQIYKILDMDVEG